MTNYYIILGFQADNDAEAIAKAADIANQTGEAVDLRVCGTQDRVCKISDDGALLCGPSKAKS